MVSSEKIKFVALDSMTDDAFGSWELWWAVKTEFPDEDMNVLSEQFVDVMSAFVTNAEAKVFRHTESDNSYVPVTFERERLAFEVSNSDKPEPDAYYWFEATEIGKKQYDAMSKEKFRDETK